MDPRDVYLLGGVAMLTAFALAAIPLLLLERRKRRYDFRRRADEAFREAYERAHEYDGWRQT